MKNFNNCNEGDTMDETYTTNYCCAICGKSYPTIEERNKCEAKCIADRKKAEEALAKKKLEDNKVARKAEIDKKYKELNTLIRGYIDDYGSLRLGETHYFDNFPALSKLLGGWF